MGLCHSDEAVNSKKRDSSVAHNSPVPGPVVDEEERRREAAAAKQRRKLSVKADLVGDIAKTDSPQSPSQYENILVPDSKEQNVKVVAVSKKGFVPHNSRKVNQDRAVFKIGFKGHSGVCMFGVMDGHGENGHKVSQYIVEHLPVQLEKQSKLTADTPAAMEAAVNATASGIKNSNIDTRFSGSTLVFVVKVGNELFIGNVGDSRCVLCSASDGKLAFSSKALSVDQKPDDPEEKARIISRGGRVAPLPVPAGDDPGPHRVWLKDVDIPGLAMSRSIGDAIAATVGVISTPVVTKHTVASNDEFLILASDGVWEFISDKEACELVRESIATTGDLQQAAERLVHESDKRWKQEEDVIDDITCIIVQFKQD